MRQRDLNRDPLYQAIVRVISRHDCDGEITGAWYNDLAKDLWAAASDPEAWLEDNPVSPNAPTVYSIAVEMFPKLYGMSRKMGRTA